MGIDKIYKVTDIDFANLLIEATETDLTVNDIPEEELFKVMDFEEFRIRLINHKGKAKILNFQEYMENRKSKS